MNSDVKAVGLKTSRDLRIDAIRGFALLVIFSDHIRGNPVREFTLAGLGFADMAEVFVFLSGYVCGIAYGRRYMRHGFMACLVRAAARNVQVYVATLSMLLATVALLEIWLQRDPEIIDAARFWQGPVPDIRSGEWWNLFTLAWVPTNFCVLALYIMLLTILPLMLVLHRRSPIAMLAVALVVYWAVQFAPDTVTLPPPWGRVLYFNPFAWQLPFFVGVALGAGDSSMAWIPQSRSATLIAGAGLQLALLAGLYYEPQSLPFADKATLGPLRILHFTFLVVLGKTLLRNSGDLWQSPMLRPFVLCGQNPLVVYCTGGLLASVGTLLLATWGRSFTLLALINTCGWALCILIASCSNGIRRLRRSETLR